MKNLKNKKLTFEQKFIVYTSIALVVFILIGFLISYLWYFYGGILKIDSSTLVTIIGISAGIPIAVIGAWAAISIARQSYSIQSRQEALENKISLIEIITPIKNDFNKLAVSMNDLLSQSLAHFELLNHFDEQVMYRDLYSQNIENYQSIITTELIERLTKSESDLFERYDSLIASLINIQNNAKSTVFWNWILAKRKKVFENSKVFQIKEEYNNINENIFLGRNLNLLLSTRDEIDNIALICENEKKAPTNFLTLEKTQIIDKMQDMSGFGSRFNLHPIHLLIVEQYTSSVIALHACGKVVSNGNSFFNADKLELVSFNNLIEILLHITLMIPSRDDVDLFIDEGPFGSLVGENQQEINILYSFDSSTMLKNNFKYLRGMALGSREKFENILNHLDIVVREDRSSAID